MPALDEAVTQQFRELIGTITGRVAARALDQSLEDELNAAFPPGGAQYQAILASCLEAIQAGWMCNREHGGIRFGRVMKCDPATCGFSIDVVDMPCLAGPHHRHPNGEIDLIMPLQEGARFDGRGAGWLVYGPGSAHSPTVSGGRALVLYLLPAGAIEFTRS